MKLFSRMLVILSALLVASWSYANSVELQCNSQSQDGASNSEISVITKAAMGEYSAIRFSCVLNQPMVLHFPLYYPDSYTLTLSDGSPTISLTSPQRAFLLPQGQATFILRSESNKPLNLALNLSPVEQFSRNNSISIAIVFLSSGFFLAMGIQVGLVGRRLQQNKLFFYPLYMFIAMCFLFFQEGANNVIAPQWIELNSFAIRGPLAGLGILAAYMFLLSTLKLRQVMSGVFCKIMDTLAVSVALIILAQPFLSLEDGRRLGEIVGYISVVLLALIIIGNVKAIMHQVIAAKVILLGISVLFVSLGLRVFTFDTWPLISRYSLTFGLALEAVIFSIAISLQVRQMRRQWLRARHESQMDPLCPVLNRRGWFQQGRELLRVHKLQGGYLTIVFVDLDDFKQVNDTYGHNIGDELLLIATRIIINQAREGDIIGRIGGDEFVIMSHSHVHNEAEIIIQRLRNKFTDLVVSVNELSIPLKASVGGKVFAVVQDDLEKTLHEVDQLMYSVKRERQGKSATA